MVKIPQERIGELCPHGYPLEFKSQCPQCQSESETKIEYRGAKPQISFTEQEMNQILENIEKGEIEAGKLVRFTAPAIEGEVPLIAEEREPTKSESKLEKLEREAAEAAARLIEVATTSSDRLKDKHGAKKILSDIKIEEAQRIVNEYLEIFKNPKAKKIGRRALSAAVAELTADLNPTLVADLDTTMVSIGLFPKQYRKSKEAENRA